MAYYYHIRKNFNHGVNGNDIEISNMDSLTLTI